MKKYVTAKMIYLACAFALTGFALTACSSNSGDNSMPQQPAPAPQPAPQPAPASQPGS
jgi:hypothetical protein